MQGSTCWLILLVGVCGSLVQSVEPRQFRYDISEAIYKESKSKAIANEEVLSNKRMQNNPALSPKQQDIIMYEAIKNVLEKKPFWKLLQESRDKVLKLYKIDNKKDAIFEKYFQKPNDVSFIRSLLKKTSVNEGGDDSQEYQDYMAKFYDDDEEEEMAEEDVNSQEEWLKDQEVRLQHKNNNVEVNHNWEEDNIEDGSEYDWIGVENDEQKVEDQKVEEFGMLDYLVDSDGLEDSYQHRKKRASKCHYGILC